MNKYDKIINLPHYELKNHKRMSIGGGDKTPFFIF